MTFSDLGIDLKNRRSGQIKTTCPKCSEERRKNKDSCLSVNIDKGIFNCHHCGWNGTINENMNILKSKSYVIPQVNNTQLSDRFLNWFQNRGISKATIIRFDIRESLEFIGGEKSPCINFPYYRDNKVVNIKFRDEKKNFKLVKDAELIFYNIDSLLESSEAIICEGEIDCLSFHESGLFSVVSVPNGASRGNQNLEYLDNCVSYFKNKEKIYLATDADQPGIKLREELARRLGKERCHIIDFYEYGVKDANELLTKSGPVAVKLALEEARPYPIEGVDTVDKMEQEIEILFREGYPRGVRIGQKDFDEHFTPRLGDLTTVTGIPGHGKTSVMNYIQMLLAVNHRWKFAVYSPENPNSIHFIKFAELFSGKKWEIVNSEYKLSRENLNDAKEFIKNHFFWINANDIDTTIDGLLSKCKEMIFRYGINCFILDPYNYIESKIPTGQPETGYINDVVGKLKRFARVNNIHIFLVAHPRKMEKDNDGKYKVPTLYDIAGSAHFFNKTDNGFVVYRDYETNVTTVYIQKIRFNFLGKLGSFQLNQDPYNNRFYGVGEAPVKGPLLIKETLEETMPF